MKVPLTNLRAFEAAARRLSFTLAADELNLTQSAISQQVKQLEGYLGFKLFNRLTRRLELTDSGRRLFETLHRCLDDIDRVVDELRNEGSGGSIVISLGSSFAANWLIPKLGKLGGDCPEIDLSIKLSDELIDVYEAPAIDVAVRFAHPCGQKVVVRKLAPERVFVVCSPSLLKNLRRLKVPQDLAAYPLLHNESSDREKTGAGNWTNWLSIIGFAGALDVTAGPRFPRSDLLMQAALHGQGMALVWETTARHELNAGRLVKVFGGHYETSNCYQISCTPAAYAKPKVRRLVDWMIAQDAAAVQA